MSMIINVCSSVTEAVIFLLSNGAFLVIQNQVSQLLRYLLTWLKYALLTTRSSYMSTLGFHEKISVEENKVLIITFFIFPCHVSFNFFWHLRIFFQITLSAENRITLLQIKYVVLINVITNLVIAVFIL